MSDTEIIRYCSPTLAGLKTASLFTTSCHDSEHLRKQIGQINARLRNSGLRLIPLSFRNGRALIYIYRESALARDILCSASRQILEKLGYVPEDTFRCVCHLSRRIRENEVFPHEIGFFLGYPETDVISFMNGRKDYVCAGVWKAYSHPEEAKKTFSLYKRCTELYTKRLENGESIDRLIVKTN
ncbi:MAG: DUF3793 family protein [Erysipelotrichaceae bacterium]|nr:DUF3793 family protein [Erysipelotrichaceae bacterium]